MGCRRCSVVCERVSAKPVLSHTLGLIITAVSIVAGYFFLFGLGWVVRIIISEATNDSTWNCWIWEPYWWCFWNGVLYVSIVVFAVTLLVGIGFGIYYLVGCLRSLKKEIGEISEETRLIKDDRLMLKTNA